MNSRASYHAFFRFTFPPARSANPYPAIRILPIERGVVVPSDSHPEKLSQFGKITEMHEIIKKFFADIKSFNDFCKRLLKNFGYSPKITSEF
jgi:hypothetical protein